MRLGSVFGPGEASDRAAHEKQVRKRRVGAARGMQAWTELEEVELVRRGRLLVSATTDEIFSLHPGVVWETASVSAIADKAPLYFYVRDGDELTFPDRQPQRREPHPSELA